MQIPIEEAKKYLKEGQVVHFRPHSNTVDDNTAKVLSSDEMLLTDENYLNGVKRKKKK